MEKESEKQPDVDVINDENQLDPQEQVNIDLDQKQGSEKADQPTRQVPVSDETRKLHNTIAYQTRQLERAMRELSEIRNQIQSSRQQTNTTSTSTSDLDPADIEAQKDWKKGVKMVVEPEIERKVQEILDKKTVAENEKRRQEIMTQQLEASKQRVLQKYPGIEDESTEESSIYRQVINEDSSILSNVHGPEIAMYRMEERLRGMGRTPSSVKPIVDKEVSRLVRAGASNVAGRQASPTGKITLTREQKEFCDHYKMPYAEYAKHLKMQESQGGVEV